MNPIRMSASDDGSPWRRPLIKRSPASLPSLSLRPDGLAVVVTTALLAACSSPRPEASTTGEVQTTNIAYFAEAPPATPADHDPERATGTLFAPIRTGGVPATTSDGTTLRFSCGVTFVSPRYAVTAGH